MSWIEGHSPDEIAAQIRSVFAASAEPSSEWERGWSAAVSRIAAFIESDGEAL